jgi:hypothetical protein
MFPDLTSFVALNGRKFQMVDMSSPTLIRCWEILKSEYGEYKYALGGLDVRDVGADTLKRLEIFDKLTPEIQKEIIEGFTTKTQAVHELMEKARSGRKVKYPNVPKELECTVCRCKVVIQPSVLVKRVDGIIKKKGITYTMDDYVKSFKCRKCKRDSIIPNLPTELKCSCGKVVSVVASILSKRIVRLGITLEEYVRDFRCQDCFSSRGRKANPALANVPRKLVCSCGFESPCAPSSIVKRANDKGKTVEEFCKGYKCSKCSGEKRGRKRKNLTSTE